MVTRQEEKRDANICLRSPKPKGQQRRMGIQVLLQWGFVFIYPVLMNMNLHLDPEVAVPPLDATRGISSPLLTPPSPPPPFREVEDRLSSVRAAVVQVGGGMPPGFPKATRCPSPACTGCGCKEPWPKWHPAWFSTAEGHCLRVVGGCIWASRPWLGGPGAASPRGGGSTLPRGPRSGWPRPGPPVPLVLPGLGRWAEQGAALPRVAPQ